MSWSPPPMFTAPVGWEHIDGFIAIAHASSSRYLRRLRDAGKPVILTANEVETDAASVLADNHEGVRAAVDHLVGHGHSRIAFVGNLAQTDMRERYEAYRDGLSDHGLPDGGALYFPTADHVESGGRGAAAAVAGAVRSLPHVTAAITSTDRVALGLMAGLAGSGIEVPRDLAVVGFDDIEAGWLHTPSLATVNQQVGELGRQAARLVLAELRGEPVPHDRHVLSSTFLPRGS